MRQSPHHRQDVIDYYNATKREYRILWKNNQNLGIHFGYYDREHQGHNDAVLNINRKLAEIADIQATDTVLDAGCGIGGTSIWFAQNIGCKSTGISIVPWQVAKGKELVRNKGLTSKVYIQEGDYADTGLEESAYTVFLGLESIVHAEDKQAVVNEAFRLLKPGGRLVVCEYMLVNHHLSPSDKRLIQEWLDGWSMPSILSEKQYKDMARKANFKGIRFHDWTENVKPSFERLNKFIKILMPTYRVLRSMRIINEGQVANLLASNAQMEALKKDLWRYKVMVATK